MVRHAAGLLNHFQTGSAGGKTAYARQFERPNESPVLPFAERSCGKIRRSRLRSVGEITDKQRSPHWHESGHRCGSHDSLPTSEREDSNLVVAMRGTQVAGRSADVAAGDTPTVTRHAVEQREVIVVPASSGAPLQAGSGEGVSAPSNPVPNLPKPTVARAQPSSAAVESSHRGTS